LVILIRREREARRGYLRYCYKVQIIPIIAHNREREREIPTVEKNSSPCASKLRKKPHVMVWVITWKRVLSPITVSVLILSRLLLARVSGRYVIPIKINVIDFSTARLS
jgi:hypothetical protein